jgi:enoyl-CoA hydratase/carnithine racemase
MEAVPHADRGARDVSNPDQAASPPGGVSLALAGGFALITIDRPEVRNAIGSATVAALGDAISQIEASDAAVAVLTGGGDRAFVSGGDLKELNALRTVDEAAEMARSVRSVLDRLAGLPIPVIAAMNGHALGGGAEVAVAADIRIAADDINIGFNQVTLGIMPAWGGIERLTQLVGRSRAMLAIASGTRYDAEQAQRIGLLDLVVPRAEFHDQWRKCAEGFAALAPGATRAIKSVIASFAPAVHDSTRDNAIAQFADLWVGDAHWEAVEALTRRT